MYVISDAHIHGVTSITTTSDCKRIVSGGSEVINSFIIKKRVRWECGKLVNKHKLWKLQWKSTDIEYGAFK